MSAWLGPVLAVGCAMVIGMALLLWGEMRRAERLSARLRVARHGAGSLAPAEPEEGLPPACG